jgi:MFS family permease
LLYLAASSSLASQAQHAAIHHDVDVFEPQRGRARRLTRRAKFLLSPPATPRSHINTMTTNTDGDGLPTPNTPLIRSEISPRSSSSTANKEVSYWSSLNSNFRWYLLSYLVTVAGEWLTYVASIAAIEEIHSSSDGGISRTSISILIILRLLPSSLFASVGGVLADSYDRRKIMFILDVMGFFVAWLYVWSYNLQSTTALYIATLLQMTVAAVYEPSRTAIVPMLVLEESNLEKAMILVSSSETLMQAVGSSIGGILTGTVGIQSCFMFDSLSYLVSAFFIWKISGDYDPTIQRADVINEESDSLTDLFLSMTKEGVACLSSQSWGAFVLLKFSAALIYGSADVLNVSFSEQEGDSSSDINLEESSKRLGILFAFVGVGCIIGPILIEPYSHVNDISSLERACLVSYLLMAIGYFGTAFNNEFLLICIFSAIRAAGSNIVWIYSSLLLQILSRDSMLGRVVAVDYAIATLSEALSALLAGLLQDNAGISAANVSLSMALVASATLVIWIIYFSRVSSTIPTSR